MTKKQKIWLGIFLAMFIIPEVLWSPVMNYWYAIKMPAVKGSYQVWRDNFLHHYGNANLWSNLILFQFLGLLFLIIFLVVQRKHIPNKVVYWLTISVLIVLALFVLNMYRLSSMHITF